jgi:ribonuclease HI
LKVLWVDDLLLSPTDTEMNTDIINGITINTNTNLEFPYQAKPSKSDFVLWKDSVHRSLCIYRNDISGWKAIVRSRFAPSGIPTYGDDPQSDYKDIVEAIAYHLNLKDKFNYLPSKFKDIIGNINLPDHEGFSLVQALKSGNAVLANDGSYLEHKKIGTHAYLLVSKDTDLGQIKGSALSPHSDLMSSAPTEHYGAIAVITILVVLLYHHKEDGLGWPQVTLYIDNDEIVRQGDIKFPKFRNAKQYLVHDYDLWMVTSSLLRSIHLSVDFEWVKGHQTLDVNNEDILPILLNTEVDKLATEQYKRADTLKHRGLFCTLELFAITKKAFMYNVLKMLSLQGNLIMLS